MKFKTSLIEKVISASTPIICEDWYVTDEVARTLERTSSVYAIRHFVVSGGYTDLRRRHKEEELYS